MMKYLSILLAMTVVLLSASTQAFAEVYTLEGVLARALDGADALKAAKEEVDVAEEQVRKARSAFLPDATVFGKYTRYSEEKTIADFGITIQPKSTTSWGLRLDQSISLGGGELNALRAAGHGLKAAEYGYRDIRDGYLYSVSEAYYGVLKASSAGDIAEANLKRLTAHRDAAEARLKVGEATKTVLLRAEAELASAGVEVVRATNALKLAKSTLQRLACIEGEFEAVEPESIVETAGSCEPEISSLDCLLDLAFKSRADLAQAKRNVESAGEMTGQARSTYWPSLSFEAVYSGTESSPSSEFQADETIYGGLMLSVPLFEGGVRKAAIGEAKARRRQAEALYEDMRKNARLEVESALLDITTLRENVLALEKQLAFAADNFNAVSKQFQFGLADSVDVMDANTLLLSTERLLSSERLDYQLSLIKLKRTTGVLLDWVNSGTESGR